MATSSPGSSFMTKSPFRALESSNTQSIVVNNRKRSSPSSFDDGSKEHVSSPRAISASFVTPDRISGRNTLSTEVNPPYQFVSLTQQNQNNSRQLTFPPIELDEATGSSSIGSIVSLGRNSVSSNLSNYSTSTSTIGSSATLQPSIDSSVTVRASSEVSFMSMDSPSTSGKTEQERWLFPRRAGETQHCFFRAASQELPHLDISQQLPIVRGCRVPNSFFHRDHEDQEAPELYRGPTTINLIIQSTYSVRLDYIDFSKVNTGLFESTNHFLHSSDRNDQIKQQVFNYLDTLNVSDEKKTKLKNIRIDLLVSLMFDGSENIKPAILWLIFLFEHDDLMEALSKDQSIELIESINNDYVSFIGIDDETEAFTTDQTKFDIAIASFGNKLNEHEEYVSRLIASARVLKSVYDQLAQIGTCKSANRFFHNEVLNYINYTVKEINLIKEFNGSIKQYQLDKGSMSNDSQLNQLDIHFKRNIRRLLDDFEHDRDYFGSVYSIFELSAVLKGLKVDYNNAAISALRKIVNRIVCDSNDFFSYSKESKQNQPGQFVALNKLFFYEQMGFSTQDAMNELKSIHNTNVAWFIKFMQELDSNMPVDSANFQYILGPYLWMVWEKLWSISSGRYTDVELSHEYL